jgi:hypothetical protein
MGGKAAGISPCALSTTPRRNVRESSLRSAGAEAEVKDAGDRGRRDIRERDESEDTAARRTLNDAPDPFADRGVRAPAAMCSSAPAYRCRSAKCDDERRHDKRSEVRRLVMSRPRPRTRRGRGSKRRSSPRAIPAPTAISGTKTGGKLVMSFSI